MYSSTAKLKLKFAVKVTLDGKFKNKENHIFVNLEALERKCT
jgi:hypothetical protein